MGGRRTVMKRSEIGVCSRFVWHYRQINRTLL